MKIADEEIKVMMEYRHTGLTPQEHFMSESYEPAKPNTSDEGYHVDESERLAEIRTLDKNLIRKGISPLKN